jgi:DNA polymerase I-like protein with 3'-5' exonuclease and polymerase domains
MGLDPFPLDKQIVTVQFSHTAGTAVVVKTLGLAGPALEQLVAQVRWLLTTPTISLRGANLKYDLLWVWLKWAAHCLNFRMDTTVVGSMLNENRSNSLKWHCRECTTMGGYETDFETKYDKGHMEAVPWETEPEALVYTGGDADGCLRVSKEFRQALREERSTQRLYVKIVHPALRAFEMVERRGVVVDLKKYEDLRQELRQFLQQKNQQMVGMLSARFLARHGEKIQERLAEGKAALTPAMLKEHFFDPHYGMGLKPRMTTEKSGEPSTAHEHLTMFHDVPEAKAFVELMKAEGTARKTETTYVTGFLKHLRADGRFHPTYMLFKGGLHDGDRDDEASGTNTGRTAAKDPAWQTVPQHTDWAKKLQDCFPAPPGKVCWKKDFKQGELKIVGCVAGEDKMIEVYTAGSPLNKLTGGDMHAVTGAKFASMEIEEFLTLKYVDEALFKTKRQHGKHGNFGMLYGISPAGFQAYAWRKGIALTLEQAEAYLTAFFDLYPGLRAYHQRQISDARKYGRVVSPFGRVRHLPLIRSPDSYTRGREERRSINAPIQSALSEMCTWAAALIEERLGEEAGLCGMIHDSLHGYVDEDRQDEVLGKITEIMDNLPVAREFDWEVPLKFDTDTDAGPTLGQMKPWKLAA